MKLNNKGWGLNTLLFCMCGILFALLISCYYVYKLSYEFQKYEKNHPEEKIDYTDDSSYYSNKENELIEATQEYLENNDIEITSNETIILEADELTEKKYLNSITDSKTGNKCNGYSTIKNNNGEYIISPFINCNNYQTKGYGEY